jgi:predicted nucleic acid-binding protein
LGGRAVIVVDTGVLYALADHSDTHHQACTRWLQAVSDDLIIPSLVITEAAYLISVEAINDPCPDRPACAVTSLFPGRAAATA